MATQKNLQMIIIISNSQLVVSSSYDKISVPKEIIIFVEEIRRPSIVIKDIIINICNRVVNKDANRISKSADM